MRRALAVIIVLVGCGGEAAAPSPASEAPVTESSGESSATSARQALGTVTGLVRLARGAQLPRWPDNPMAARGPAARSECPPASDADAIPVTVATTGGLRGVSIVAAGDDPSRWVEPGPSRTHTIRFDQCRMRPSLIVATRGDRLRVENDTTFPFFPAVGDAVLRAVVPTDPIEVELSQGGLRTIECGFASPCGRVDVITLYHPVHSVTGADGRFRMENVPADQPVRITAWHPLFQEARVETRVAAGGQVEVELVLTPVPAEAFPTAPVADAGPLDPRMPN